MKKTGKILASLVLAFMMPLGNTAFALDGVFADPVEPDYKDIVEEIFPGYQEDPQISPNWTSGDPDSANPLTHGYITQVAYDLLRDDNLAADTFYSGQRTALVRGSVLPDADETDGVFAWHFYGPDGTNWQGGSITAYTKCIEHYENAVDLYVAGFESEAMEVLGRALHYLQDINVPHHVMNAIAGITNHKQFENYAEENRYSYEVTGLTPSIYTDADHSLGTIIDDYAETARDWYDDAASNNKSDWDVAAGACVRNSQRATATVLYKFMYDVGFIMDVR